MRAILVLSDLTRASDEALRTAARMAARTGAGLHVLHDVGVVGLPLREAYPLLERTAHDRLLARLEEQLHRTLPPGGEPASRHLDYRALPEAARDRARAVAAELIVAGPHAADDAGLAALAAAAGYPVLLARGAGAPPFRRVLVPAGPGDLGATLPRACAWVQRWEAEPGAEPRAGVHVLHVCPRLRDWRETGARLDAEIRAVEEDVWRASGRLQRHVRWAPAPGPAILQAAVDTEADLIVLRPRPAGASGATRTWRTVTAQAGCSVLLLPPGDGPPADPPPAGPAARVPVSRTVREAARPFNFR